MQINDTSIEVGDNVNISIEVTDNVEIRIDGDYLIINKDTVSDFIDVLNK